MIPDIDLAMQAGPHTWSPVTVRHGFLWLRKRTYCKGCYLTEGEHPVPGWTPARPLGDKRPPVHRAELEKEPRE